MILLFATVMGLLRIGVLGTGNFSFYSLVQQMFTDRIIS